MDATRDRDETSGRFACEPAKPSAPPLRDRIALHAQAPHRTSANPGETTLTGTVDAGRIG